jgi:hypothetical protein
MSLLEGSSIFKDNGFSSITITSFTYKVYNITFAFLVNLWFTLFVMEKLVLKQYGRLKVSDLLSCIFGVLGIIFGTTSIIALSPVWPTPNGSRDSSILTICSLIFDTLSTFMAVQAFIFSRVIKEIKITNGVYIRKREKIGGLLDLLGFASGAFGLIFGWLSLIALFPFWDNEQASVIATGFSVFLDFWSCVFVLAAVVVIESIHNKYFTNEPTRGLKHRVSRRQGQQINKKQSA